MNRILKLFRDVRTEMSKVVWPTRYDTIRYTITVVIFSLVIAVILGAFDYGLLQGLQALIK